MYSITEVLIFDSTYIPTKFLTDSHECVLIPVLRVSLVDLVVLIGLTGFGKRNPYSIPCAGSWLLRWRYYWVYYVGTAVSGWERLYRPVYRLPTSDSLLVWSPVISIRVLLIWVSVFVTVIIRTLSLFLSVVIATPVRFRIVVRTPITTLLVWLVYLPFL